MKPVRVLAVVLVAFTLGNATGLYATPFVITQSKPFYLDEYARVSRWGINENGVKTFDQYHLAQTRDIDLTFIGAPSSLTLVGERWDLSSVSFQIEGWVSYTVEAYCTDGVLSDCVTKGTYSILHDFTDDNVFSPFFGGVWAMQSDSGNIDLHDESFWDIASDYYGKSHKDPTYRSMTFLPENVDLGFVDVESYTIQLYRQLNIDLNHFDSNDDENYIQIVDYKWEGNVNIAYEYNVVSTAIPEPSAVFLLGFGMLGIVGARRRMKKRALAAGGLPDQDQ